MFDYLNYFKRSFYLFLFSAFKIISMIPSHYEIRNINNVKQSYNFKKITQNINLSIAPALQKFNLKTVIVLLTNSFSIFYLSFSVLKNYFIVLVCSVCKNLKMFKNLILTCVLLIKKTKFWLSLNDNVYTTSS